MVNRNKEHYSNWLSDTIQYLKDEFIETRQDEFDKYCLEQYHIERNEK